MIRANNNPLLIPEIIDRVSLFVPVWTRNGNCPDSFLFTPQDIVSSSLVSRTWYRLFYPHLWSIYDSEIMYSSRCCDDNIYNKKDTPRQYFKVPEELLVSQSHRFRIITNFVPRFSTLLQCRQLTALTLFRTCPRSCHLVKTNPFLKTLAWFGQVPYSGYFSDLETDSFSNLKSLENLTLNQWSLSAEDLVPILWRNQKTLRRLELKLVQGLDVFDSVTILSNFQEQEAAYMEEDEPKITTLEALALERLEELVVDVEWPENPGLLELITEFCPNLKTLTLSSSLTDDKAMMIILENRLKESNPLLRMEKISHGAQYSHFA